jgi:hypothetical protein
VWTFYNLPHAAPLADLSSAAQRLCARPWGDVAAQLGQHVNAERFCMWGPYVVELLGRGLGLAQDRLAIGGGDVSWPLGAALVEGGQLPELAGRGAVAAAGGGGGGGIGGEVAAGGRGGAQGGGPAATPAGGRRDRPAWAAWVAGDRVFRWWHALLLAGVAVAFLAVQMACPGWVVRLRMPPLRSTGSDDGAGPAPRLRDDAQLPVVVAHSRLATQAIKLSPSRANVGAMS